jgi:ankyrin repeat protein
VLSGLEKKDKTGETNLLPLCELIYLFEENGVAAEHAKKLSTVFKNLKASLKYLASFKGKNSDTADNRVMHDACLFGMPEPGTCRFGDWQKLAANHMLEKSFRKLFEHAASIEAQIKVINSVRANPKARELKTVEKELIKAGQNLKKLSRKDSARTTAEEDEEIAELVRSVANLKLELANASSGIILSKLNLTQLDAIYEKYKLESNKAHATLVEAGVMPNKIAQFLRLIRQDSDERIPNIVIEGESIGHPGYRLRKLHVLEDEDAALGAVLGRKTNCCQSLTGEAGEACAIHGLTSLEGGFYVLFNGNEVMGQAWAWRSKNDAIVFDSVEIARDVSRDLTKAFFESLAVKLVENKHTSKVACGARSGISNTIGTESPHNKNEEFLDYTGYADSQSCTQRVLIELDTIYLRYGDTEFSNHETEKMIALLMTPERDLLKSRKFMEIMSYALMTKNEKLQNLLIETAKKSSQPDKINAMLHLAIKKRDTNFCLKLIELIEKGADINAKDKQRDTMLYSALEYKLTDVCLALIEKGVDINTQDNNGCTMLHFAILSKDINVFLKLIEKGADINAQDNDGCTMLHFAILSKDINIFLKLIEKGADINAQDKQRRTALHLAMENKDISFCLKLIEAGADINAKDKHRCTALHLAVILRRTDICLALIEKGADINAQDVRGRTALHLAIEKKDINFCLKLIEKGADINTENNDGDTALHLAMENKDINLCLKLIETGASYDDELRLKLIQFEEVRIAIERIEGTKAEKPAANATPLLRQFHGESSNRESNKNFKQESADVSYKKPSGKRN